MSRESRWVLVGRAILGGWLLLLSVALAVNPHEAAGFARYGHSDGLRWILAGSEIVAALLFLVPASAAIGEAALLAVFAAAAALHLRAHENPALLFVYAALVVLLAVARRRTTRA
jgi:hypothetical protein